MMVTGYFSLHYCLHENVNLRMSVPRPNAIATLLLTEDFIAGAQTLLYSLHVNLPSSPYAPDYYPPEIVVLVTQNISQEARNTLSFLCTRIIEVDVIPIPNSEDDNQSHQRQWTECGYTKLNIFRQFVYHKILYIDCDCLVQKDVSGLFKLEHEMSRGLIAAAPDIFPPDKFNAGVLLISPSKVLFDELLEKAKNTVSYDGGDTGFLNAVFNEWYSYPIEGRLSFKYNAQRFMHQCTYGKQPKYWDVGVGNIAIIHYSSSPKPWQDNASSSTKDASIFLTKDDSVQVRRAKLVSQLDTIWKKYYKRSQIFLENCREDQKFELKPKAKKVSNSQGSSVSASSAEHKQVSLKYKELRRLGLDTKDAMTQARKHYGLGEIQSENAGKKVAAMFGMTL